MGQEPKIQKAQFSIFAQEIFAKIIFANGNAKMPACIFGTILNIELGFVPKPNPNLT